MSPNDAAFMKYINVAGKENDEEVEQPIEYT